MIFISFN